MTVKCNIGLQKFDGEGWTHNCTVVTQADVTDDYRERGVVGVGENARCRRIRQRAASAVVMVRMRSAEDGVNKPMVQQRTYDR